jgi:hypothetical protein
MLKPMFQQMQNQFPMQNNQGNPPINPTQFKQFLPQLNDNILQQMANQARAQGISENDITVGLNFIKKMM